MTTSNNRDAPLAMAIARAGGVGALARLLGLAQPTISCWKRVPPHRVIEVEGATGISRRILRPDLYDVPEPPLATSEVCCDVRSPPGWGSSE